MGKKDTEIRLFNGGVNADDAPALIKNNELINAQNITISNPYGGPFGGAQDSGAIHSIYPPSDTSVSAILASDGGTHTLIGKWADSRINTIFFFFYQNAGLHKIIKLFDGLSASILLRDAAVIGGLGWTADMYISARMFGDLLIFTDGVHDTRFVNHTKTYAAGTISQSVLSFIQEPFSAPLEATRVTDANVYSFSVQLNAFQFTCRVQNNEGFTSVLAPFSETVLPVRESIISAIANSGNTIEAELNLFIKVPFDWQVLDFIVRNVNDNTFFVYRSFDRSNPADLAAITAHNAGTALSAVYTGEVKYVVDDFYTEKLFDFMPQTSKHIEVSSNRVILANNVLGYDAPAVPPPNLSITQNIVNTVMPATTSVTVYMVTSKNYDVTEDNYPIYAALLVYYNSKVWGLPKEYASLRFNGSTQLSLDNRAGKSYPYLPPQLINKNDLVEIPDYFAGTLAGSFGNPFPYLETLSSPVNNGFNLLEAGLYPYNAVFAKYVWNMHDLGGYIE